tara:strand:+ start:2966 stop:3877 length:912 start_codon:yes stop_codon:yes gene_type:complete
MEFYISQKDWKKVIDFAQASYDKFSAEIGGFMVAKPDKDGNMIISEPEILKQEVTGGTTTMDKEAVADYYVKCAEKHGNDVRFVWWHSHANMSAFWSGTDTSTMEEYNSGDWAAFLVVNIRSEYKFRVCVWNPIEAHKDIELNILGAKAKKVPKAITDSVSKLCKEPKTNIANYKTFKGRTWNTGNKYTLPDSRQTSIYDYDYGNYGGYSYNGYGRENNDPLLQKTVDMLDDWNDEFLEGTMIFKDWLKSVKEWNKMLKGMDKTFDIKELTEDELLEQCGVYAGYSALKLLNLGEKNGQNIEV